MAEILTVHPENPQMRLIQRAAEIIEQGGIVAYPTDSSYALACHLGDKHALDRIRRIRRVDLDHDFTLICKDLSEISTYARVGNWAYRLLKSLTPGPYTFVLLATKEVPKRLQDPKKRTIGIRVPDNAIAQALVKALGQPLMSSTLLLPGDDIPLNDIEEMQETIGSQIEAIIDGGPAGIEPTTVLDLVEGDVKVLRRGKGDVSSFE